MNWFLKGVTWLVISSILLADPSLTAGFANFTKHPGTSLALQITFAERRMSEEALNNPAIFVRSQSRRVRAEEYQKFKAPATRSRNGLVVLSLAAMSFLSPAMAQAHEFVRDSSGHFLVKMAPWNAQHPADNTLGGIARDVLRAARSEGYPIRRIDWHAIQHWYQTHILSANSGIHNADFVSDYGHTYVISDIPSDVQDRLLHQGSHLAKQAVSHAPSHSAIPQTHLVKPMSTSGISAQHPQGGGIPVNRPAIPQHNAAPSGSIQAPQTGVSPHVIRQPIQHSGSVLKNPHLVTHHDWLTSGIIILIATLILIGVVYYVRYKLVKHLRRKAREFRARIIRFMREIPKQCIALAFAVSRFGQVILRRITSAIPRRRATSRRAVKAGVVVYSLPASIEDVKAETPQASIPESQALPPLQDIPVRTVGAAPEPQEELEAPTRPITSGISILPAVEVPNVEPLHPLGQRLADYLAISSRPGHERAMREYLLTELRDRFDERINRVYAPALGPKNLVVDIKPTPGHEQSPLLAFCAHIDAHETKGQTLRASARDSDTVYEMQGMDDKAAVAAIMGAVAGMDDQHMAHGPIRLIFTAEEENGFRGAEALVTGAPTLFEDVDVLISVDGPLADSPLAVKWLNAGRTSLAQHLIRAAASEIPEYRLREFHMSAGDEQVLQYAEQKGRKRLLPIAHIRANYENMHRSDEQITLENLSVLTQWLQAMITEGGKSQVTGSQQQINAVIWPVFAAGVFLYDPTFGAATLGGAIAYLTYRWIGKQRLRPRRNGFTAMTEDSSNADRAMGSPFVPGSVSPGNQEYPPDAPTLIRRGKQSADQAALKPAEKVPSDSREITQSQIEGFYESIGTRTRQAWPEAFHHAGRKGRLQGLWELPMPVPLSRVEQIPDAQSRVLFVLHMLNVWMEGTDAQVWADLRQSVDEARRTVDTKAMHQRNRLSDAQLVDLLTTGYIAEFKRHVAVQIGKFMAHIHRFYAPTPAVRRLRVSAYVENAYPRLPRYLKWLFSENPTVLDNYEIQAQLQDIENRMRRFPEFNPDLSDYARDAFARSMQSNPELGFRVLRWFTGGRAGTPAVRPALAAGPAAVSPQSAEPISPVPTTLAETPQKVALPEKPAIDPQLVADAEARLKEITDELSTRTLILKERRSELEELTSAYKEAEASDEKVCQQVLEPAIKGLEQDIRHVEETVQVMTEKSAEASKELDRLRGVSGVAFAAGAMGVMPPANAAGLTSHPVQTVMQSWHDVFAWSQNTLAHAHLPHDAWIVYAVLTAVPMLSLGILTILSALFRPDRSEDPVHGWKYMCSVGLGFPLYFLTQRLPTWRIRRKIRRKNLYAYWQRKEPPYYRKFREETQSLASGFRAPGEKFQLSYDSENIVLRPGDDALPITDSLEATRIIVLELRVGWPRFYERLKNQVYGRRTVPEYRDLDAVLVVNDVREVVEELLKRLPGWDMEPGRRLDMTSRLVEIQAADQTRALRRQIRKVRAGRARAAVEETYWKQMSEAVGQIEKLKSNTKMMGELRGLYRRRVAYAAERAVPHRPGLLQFYLSGGTMADFMTGLVSQDCTSDLQFWPFTGSRTDPAFMLFKIVENGLWVGNIYGMIFKDQHNRLAFLLDSFQLPDHPVARSRNHREFMRDFVRRFSFYLTSTGFDLWLVRPMPSSQQWIGSALEAAVHAEGHKPNQELDITKVGGLDHLRDFALGTELLQAIGNIRTVPVRFKGTVVVLRDVDAERRKQNEGRLRDARGGLTKLIGELSRQERAEAEVRQAFAQLQAGYEREVANNRLHAAERYKAALDETAPRLTEQIAAVAMARSRTEAMQKEVEALQAQVDGGSKVAQKVTAGVAAVLLLLAVMPSHADAATLSPEVWLHHVTNWCWSTSFWGPGMLAVVLGTVWLWGHRAKSRTAKQRLFKLAA